MQWARCMALHEARRRLRAHDRGDASVEEIARNCGFRHMGRFAGYYGALFGEFPSATLAHRAAPFRESDSLESHLDPEAHGEAPQGPARIRNAS